MQTYRVASPRSTHTRPATCVEYGCKERRSGWTTVVPAGSPDPRAYTADYVRAVARGDIDGIRRPCTERRAGDGLVAFTFPPETTCFRQSTHRVSLERPEFYLVRGGDWRGSTGLIRRHVGPRAAEHWVEDMSTSLAKVRREINGKG